MEISGRFNCSSIASLCFYWQHAVTMNGKDREASRLRQVSSRSNGREA